MFYAVCVYVYIPECACVCFKVFAMSACPYQRETVRWKVRNYGGMAAQQSLLHFPPRILGVDAQEPSIIFKPSDLGLEPHLALRESSTLTTTTSTSPTEYAIIFLKMRRYLLEVLIAVVYRFSIVTRGTCILQELVGVGASCVSISYLLK